MDTKTLVLKENSILKLDAGCNTLLEKIIIPELKPLMLENLNVEELDIPSQKNNKYSRNLDQLINQSFVTKTYHGSHI